jgi:hypothetical protein
MRRLAWAAALGLLVLLGPAAGARADRAGEIGERLRHASAVLGEMAAGKEDTAIPGRRAVLRHGAHPLLPTAQETLRATR